MDNEFLKDTSLKVWLQAKSVSLEINPLYEHHQSGVAERAWRTEREKASAMMSDADLANTPTGRAILEILDATTQQTLRKTELPESLWSYAFMHAIWLKNRSPSRALKLKMTPWEARSGYKPDISVERIWGSRVYCVAPEEMRSKSLRVPRGWLGYFVGLESESILLIYNQEKNKVYRIGKARIDDGNGMDDPVPGASIRDRVDFDELEEISRQHRARPEDDPEAAGGGDGELFVQEDNDQAPGFPPWPSDDEDSDDTEPTMDGQSSHFNHHPPQVKMVNTTPTPWPQQLLDAINDCLEGTPTSKPGEILPLCYRALPREEWPEWLDDKKLSTKISKIKLNRKSVPQGNSSKEGGKRSRSHDWPTTIIDAIQATYDDDCYSKLAEAVARCHETLPEDWPDWCTHAILLKKINYIKPTPPPLDVEVVIAVRFLNSWDEAYRSRRLQETILAWAESRFLLPNAIRRKLKKWWTDNCFHLTRPELLARDPKINGLSLVSQVEAEVRKEHKYQVSNAWKWGMCRSGKLVCSGQPGPCTTCVTQVKSENLRRAAGTEGLNRRTMGCRFADIEDNNVTYAYLVDENVFPSGLDHDDYDDPEDRFTGSYLTCRATGMLLCNGEFPCNRCLMNQGMAHALPCKQRLSEKSYKSYRMRAVTEAAPPRMVEDFEEEDYDYPSVQSTHSVHTEEAVQEASDHSPSPPTVRGLTDSDQTGQGVTRDLFRRGLQHFEYDTTGHRIDASSTQGGGLTRGREILPTDVGQNPRKGAKPWEKDNPVRTTDSDDGSPDVNEATLDPRLYSSYAGDIDEDTPDPLLRPSYANVLTHAGKAATRETQTHDSVGDQGRMIPDSYLTPSSFPNRAERRSISKLKCMLLSQQHKALGPEPMNPRQARRMPDSTQWKQAEADEYSSLQENDTWLVVPRPKDRKVLGSRWVYKRKMAANGLIAKHKARIVVKGYSQIYGLDFDETYASVVKAPSYRLLFAAQARYGWKCHQMDIKTAFLNGKVEHETYVEAPEGYPQGDGDNVLLLKRSLYGLQQSPRLWYQRLRFSLESRGWKASQYDQSVFIHPDGMYMTVYVDDLLIFGPDEAKITKVKQSLSEEFKMTDLGLCSYYLGIHVHQRDNGDVHLHQTNYLQQILERFGFGNKDRNRKTATPMDSRLKLKKREELPQLLRAIRLYQSEVSSVNYAMIETRPDIAEAVGVVSQYCSNPSKEHEEAVERTYDYLSDHLTLGLHYKHKPE